jgi:hypothetical protein
MSLSDSYEFMKRLQTRIVNFNHFLKFHPNKPEQISYEISHHCHIKGESNQK